MIEQTRFGTRKTIQRSFDDVVESTRRALTAQEFAIVSEVNLEPQLRAESSSRRCTMLGAWNALASPALEREPDLGAMMPCHVVIYEQSTGQCVVSVVDPCNALEMVGPDTLVERAVLDSRQKLQRAIEDV
jgi:uncharacterized protein (DUF302 family)